MLTSTEEHPNTQTRLVRLKIEKKKFAQSKGISSDTTLCFLDRMTRSSRIFTYIGLLGAFSILWLFLSPEKHKIEGKNAFIDQEAFVRRSGFKGR